MAAPESTGEELKGALEVAGSSADFPHLARLLLYHYDLWIDDTPYALAEIEFYLHNRDHPDPYVHRNPDQLQTSGRWCFHRASPAPGAAFRGGTYKGLDITFGRPGDAGGVLIRAIYRLADGAYTEGPCKTVERILEDLGYPSIQALVQDPAYEFAERDAFDNLRFRLERRRAPRPVQPPDAATVPEYPGYALTIREGLRVPNRLGAQEHRIHFWFWGAPYRYVARPDLVKKHCMMVSRSLIEAHGLGAAKTILGGRPLRVQAGARHGVGPLIGRDEDDPFAQRPDAPRPDAPGPD